MANSSRPLRSSSRRRRWRQLRPPTVQPRSQNSRLHREFRGRFPAPGTVPLQTNRKQSRVRRKETTSCCGPHSGCPLRGEFSTHCQVSRQMGQQQSGANSGDRSAFYRHAWRTKQIQLVGRITSRSQCRKRSPVPMQPCLAGQSLLRCWHHLQVTIRPQVRHSATYE